MIVEPYDSDSLSIDRLETVPAKESNCMSNTEHLHKGGQSALFSAERGTRGARSRIEGFLSQLFHARDLTINVEALTCCERALPDDAACPYKP